MAKRKTPASEAGPTAGARPAPRRIAGDVPVVVVGASAGGLEPIGQFLGGIPADSGLAFVVIQHLDPAGRSMLPELLSRQTKLKVQQAVDGASLRPNEVYVIPPGAYLSISSRKLHLSPAPAGQGARMPIDLFLRSLAVECRERGIGVILSGAGSDGGEGLRALKNAGGLTIVQDPDEALHDGMPTNAISAARPDFVLRVRDMPAVLKSYVSHSYVKMAKAPPRHEAMAEADPATVGAITDHLRSSTGKDFGLYKPGMLQRRAERRLALHGIQTWDDYIALLRKSPAETEALFADLLINVTRFFRDPEAFAALAKPLDALLKRRPAGEPVRVWALGCSSGEEVYSLAILLSERLAAMGQSRKLQIFATDIDDEALDIARAGVYPDSIQADVTEARLKRYFVREDGHYRIAKEMRGSVIFSRHDVLHDPPFSRLDLATCRNLLIYLVPNAQQHVLGMLHFALRDGGLLLLGSAESVASAPGLFEPIDEKLRIYRRRGGDRAARHRFAFQGGVPGGERMPLVARSMLNTSPTLPELVQRLIFQTYAPAAVVTNRQFDPIYYSGAVDRFLQIVPGTPNQDLLSMSRDGLRAKLRATVLRALRAKRRVATHGVWLQRNGKPTAVTIEAERIPGEDEDLVLVTFVDELPKTGEGPRAAADDRDEQALLREQLTEARRDLNRTIRELRHTNEELKAKNEEAMSLNEEFLSTNEELESSKEELQSLNEELSTVNGQLRATLDQQQQASADLSNLLSSSSVATILLDRDLRIKIFNPKMKTLFALIDADVGRPLADLVPKFADPLLLEDAAEVRSTGVTKEREIRAESGAWFLRTVLPYLSETGAIEGAVISFADISQLKEYMIASDGARQYAETVIEAIHEPLIVLDASMKIVSTNAAFCQAFDLIRDRAVGRTLDDLGVELLSRIQARALALQHQMGREAPGSFEIEEVPSDGSRRIWSVRTRGIQGSSSAPVMMLLTLRDVTDERRIGRRQLQLLINALPDAAFAADGARRMRFVNKQAEKLFGYGPGELDGELIDKLVPEKLRDQHRISHTGFMSKPVARAMASGLDVHGVTKTGRAVYLDVGLGPVETSEGGLVLTTLHDLEPLRSGERKLQAAMEAADRSNQGKSRLLAAASHDLRQPLQTIGLLHGVLERRAVDPESRVTLAKLNDAVAYMGELLDTLLDLKQVEGGEMTPEVVDISVARLLARAADDFAPVAATKGLNLRVVTSSATIRSDQQLLTRIIGNLLSNAIKYTDTGKVLIGCRRRGGTLRIEVWDTGQGIRPEDLNQVFDEFYRGDRGGDGRQGLGLGLYIVQRFANLLGHRVEVQSAPNSGAVFALVIDDPTFAGPKRRAAANAGAEESAAPRVLLIEDDALQLDALQQLLEMEGYHVMVARNGQQALAKVRDPRASHPDIIVADYNLAGGKNGVDVIHEVRAATRIQIPGLIVSGGGKAGNLPTTQVTGFAVISKPVNADRLLAAVAALVTPLTPDRLRPKGLPRPLLTAAPAAEAVESDIAVIDDEGGVRDAIRVALEAEDYKPAAFPSAEAFLADSDRDRFRVLIVDLSLPGLDGLELQARLKAERSNQPIIFLTGRGDLARAVQVMREGAVDFLQKPVRGATLLESVARAMRLGVKAAGGNGEPSDFAKRLKTLTNREREVMNLIVAGEMNKNIAAKLGISLRTTEHHRGSIMRKMGANSLASLVRMTLASGQDI